MHTVEAFVPQSKQCLRGRGCYWEAARYTSPGTDQIPAELIQAGGETLCPEFHKRIKLIWNKEELPHQWKESTVAPIHKNGDKTDCSNYQCTSLLSNSYKILSNSLLSRLTPYTDKITGSHQCGF
jgi:hypothetical protein